MKWFVLIGILSVAFAKHEMYKGWKSYYIGISSVDQSKALGPLIQKFELDFLSHPAEGREGVVLVKPQHQAAFVQELEAEGIAYRIHADDVKDLICRGVDANRNFDFVFKTVGTDWSPCGETYPGTHAFSQPETRVIRDILHENLARIALYINLHSFGSMIMYPWGHDGSLSQNALGLHTVGIAMANAIQNKALPNFPKYIVGNTGLVVQYFSAGAASDYAHYIGVPLAYGFELPGLEESYAGFHLDPKYIGQVCQETWEGFVVGARRAGDLFPNKQ
ncbi:hypothetical protein HF086_009744 [Spodoptera exigua]|uniref:Peptidase M14 domain-containing protein n=1 Tax=Spodoptera exigua TaxID=7107 RepID=A0A922MBH1_SPOEX|nr:hypothetical protein HF086_009744 [Spodoptera exigua]